MMECAKYSTLKSADSVVLYLDEFERKEILGQPRYGICDWMMQTFIYLIWLISLPVTWCCSFKIIPQSERVIIFRVGRVRSLKGPGLISIIPFADTWKRVDMRMRAFKVPPQEIITLDHALVKVGADVQYRIVDPIATYTQIQDINQCLRVTGQTVLTNQLSLDQLCELQSTKVSIQRRLQIHMNKVVSEWGIEIARFELASPTILKNPGGLEPIENYNADTAGGGAAIMDIIKSFTSGSSSFQMPGMMPATLPMSSPNQPSSLQSDVMSPQELFSLAKGFVDEGLCMQTNAIFEFHVKEGTGVNIWSLDLKNPPGYVKNESYTGVVDVRFTLDTADFQKIFYGQLSPTEGYMKGSLKLDGSIKTAKKLEFLIRKIQNIST